MDPAPGRNRGGLPGAPRVREVHPDTDENFETFEPHFELREVGERVLAWGTISVRGKGSGIEMDVPIGGVFDFRNGKIARWQDFGSKEKALEAVGLRE
jgi:hypothetical protein